MSSLENDPAAQAARPRTVHGPATLATILGQDTPTPPATKRITFASAAEMCEAGDDTSALSRCIIPGGQIDIETTRYRAAQRAAQMR